MLLNILACFPSYCGVVVGCCAAGPADGAHVHAQGDVLVDHDGPGVAGESLASFFFYK